MLSKPKNRTIAILLAFIGILAIPADLMGSATLWHLAGLHKFYLNQSRWGLVYILLSWTPIPVVASVVEGVWYLLQNPELFEANFNGECFPDQAEASPQPTGAVLPQVGTITDAVRQLDQLREDGLITEYEFEQKRRQLLDRIH
jgi:TM2 domain-containing membrane protein YozV